MVEVVAYRAFLHAPHDSTTTGEGSKKEEKGGQENTRSVEDGDSFRTGYRVSTT